MTVASSGTKPMSPANVLLCMWRSNRPRGPGPFFSESGFNLSDLSNSHPPPDGASALVL